MGLGRRSDAYLGGRAVAAGLAGSTRRLLAGARDGRLDPRRRTRAEPAALIARGGTVGQTAPASDMVVTLLDARRCLSGYLQQVVIESLGKRYDLHGPRSTKG